MSNHSSKPWSTSKPWDKNKPWDVAKPWGTGKLWLAKDTQHAAYSAPQATTPHRIQA